MENFFVTLILKIKEIAAQNKRLEKEAANYKKKTFNLEDERNQTSRRLSRNPAPASSKLSTSDQQVQKPIAVNLLTTTAAVKQQPSKESCPSGQKQPQKGVLEKYEFKKLTHFERMQQNRGHQTETHEPECSKSETECLDSPENVAENDKDFWEVNTPILGSILEQSLSILVSSLLPMNNAKLQALFLAKVQHYTRH
jgi:hypothetical protein